EIAGHHGWWQEDGGGFEVGLDAAAASAIGGPKAGQASLDMLGKDSRGDFVSRMKQAGQFVVVEAPAKDREVRRNDRDSEFGAMFLSEEFVPTRFWRRQENARGRVGRIFEAFVAAVDADQSF